MSRVLGRAMDVLQIVNYLQESELPKFFDDKTPTTWEEVENVKNKLKIYLPDSAIDFINKENIIIKKSPLRRYTLTSVPEYKDEKRFIRFPSNKPIKKFEREYAFYLGLLLSSYQIDTQEELLETGKEYDDILPLILEYLYMKDNHMGREFSLRHLNEIKHFSKYYKKIYMDYNHFYDFTNSSDTSELSEQEYENYLKMASDKDEEMERLTMEDITKLSSLEGTLQIIDRNLNNGQLKRLIHELMINKNENRSFVLYDYGIDSYGYKRLKKEIDHFNYKDKYKYR